MTKGDSPEPTGGRLLERVLAELKIQTAYLKVINIVATGLAVLVLLGLLGGCLVALLSGSLWP